MSLIAERYRKDRASAIFADNVFQFNLDDSQKLEDDTQVEYKDTIKQLEIHYQRFKKLVLNDQSVITGLFPEYGGTDNSNEDHISSIKISKVRDSIYCAMASWALCQAYKRVDDNNGRIHELAQSAVKCMRGILCSWMNQSDKLERFKYDQSLSNALHSQFDLETGMANELTENYENLQIDAVSLYLITLVQMISSGLQIIYTRDEVNFIQNLVFYVERAYRTPDFGMWERGTKYNNGVCELHASSIGMAKAALELINGFNVYGRMGNYWSVIYVDIDGHNRNRTILETLLPRESNSKNTDCSLIPTLGFPCFALHDEVLISKSLERLKNKLEGKYGFKRFIRDGYGTEIEANYFFPISNAQLNDENQENQSNATLSTLSTNLTYLSCNLSNLPSKTSPIGKKKLYYEKGQIKEFDGVESEWPLFYIFMIINGVFKKNGADVQHYMKLLEPLLKQTEDDIIVPKYYYVPIPLMQMERKYPGTQIRYSSPEYKLGRHFLWGQSLYLISNLLVEGHLHITELDPMRKFLPGSERPRSSSRYSFFQGNSSDLVVQIIPISESTRLQSFLSMYGIKTQTPHQVEPVQIWPPSELLKAYSFLGSNTKLGLTGRPPRPIGALGTSKFYRVCNTTIICHPLLLEVRDFYLSYDISLLLNDIRNEIMLLGKCWKLSGRPTYLFLIRESNIKSHRFSEVLDLLADMKKGEIDGIKVKLCRLQNCISTGCMEHLDFVRTSCDITFFKPFDDVSLISTGYTSFMERFPLQTSIPKENIDENLIMSLNTMTIPDLVKTYNKNMGLQTKSYVLYELWKREGDKFIFDQEAISEKMDNLIHQAGSFKLWGVVRYLSAIRGKMADSLAPSLTSLLVRGKQMSIGVFGQEEEIIDKPIMPNVIKEILYRMTMPYDIYQAVLQQELLLYVAGIINTKPFLFQGILTIRLGWLIHAIETEIQHETPPCSEKIMLHNLAPSIIKELLYEVLSTNKISDDHFSACHEDGTKVKHEILTEPRLITPFGHVPDYNKSTPSTSPDRKSIGLNRSPMRRRILEGSLNRVPSDLYQRVWDVLQKTPMGITVHGRHLPQQPILSEMTRTESNFSLTIERLLCQDPDPAHRQIVVELFMVASTILERNPELSFRNCELNVDKIIWEAYTYFKKERLLQNVPSSHHLPSIIEIDDEKIDLKPKKEATLNDDMVDFYDTPPNTPNGTMLFLAKALINILLSSQNVMEGRISEERSNSNECNVN